MDPVIISGLSALLGSLIGGSASIATTWIAQHSEDRRGRLIRELQRRESLYGDFLNECSKLMIDALDHSLDKPERMVSAYSLFNRIRLTSSASVVSASDAVLRAVIEGYFRRNMTIEEIHDMVLNDSANVSDPLGEFSRVCRDDLEALQYGRSLFSMKAFTLNGPVHIIGRE